jgi:hypothetical protein
MHLVLAALRVLGALALGFVLGVSAVQVVGVVSPDPVGVLVPVFVYGVIGGAFLALASPRLGICLLLGWAAPLLLVGLVVATDESWLTFPAITTVLYVLALGLAFYRTGHRRQGIANG